MNAFTYRFEQVLSFHEQQKQEAEADFKNAVERFEQVATELYHKLKLKEETIEDQRLRMEKGLGINEMQHYARFIEGLEKQIEQLQQVVIQARSEMNVAEEELLEKTMEVRKFEKMKEKDRDLHRAELEWREAGQLDELTTLKFRNGENR